MQHRLTRREREIVSSIARGCTDKDIALECVLTEDAVKRHLVKLFGKLGVQNRLELVIHAVGNRLLDQTP